jgi:hypothetical protein
MGVRDAASALSDAYFNVRNRISKLYQTRTKKEMYCDKKTQYLPGLHFFLLAAGGTWPSPVTPATLTGEEHDFQHD